MCTQFVRTAFDWMKNMNCLKVKSSNKPNITFTQFVRSAFDWVKNINC